MASINPFQHADTDAIDGIDDSVAEVGAQGRRARRATAGRAKTAGGRAKQRRAATRASMDYGLPEWEGLRPVMTFLLFPMFLAIGIGLTGPWPGFLLYGAALFIGIYVATSALKGIELVLVCFLLYVPFSTTYVIPIAPGINGTNLLILLSLFAMTMAKIDGRTSWFYWTPGATTVFAFAVLTALSGLTIMGERDGYEYLMYEELLNYKSWLDQFVIYFVALSCIRSIETAKRFVVYMCIGAVALAIYSVPEMLDKMGGSTIEKSRIGGPHQQPNMFGGFVAYTMLPPLAIFVTYIKDIRVWLFTPYFLLAAKILVATFSRGAYLAMAAGAFMAAYFKGKGFLIYGATLALCVLLVFPSLFPQAIKDRLFPGDETTRVSSQPERMDKSSENRIILWRAGGKMIIESPVLGKGFKGFQLLKSDYTERDVRESDPHNTYIYIASQMGLPALILFLLILGYSFHLGRLLSRSKEDLFIRAIGVGGASATVCYSIICVFGSRAISLEFTAFFWVYLVCMQVINARLREQSSELKPKKIRTNAYEVRRDIDYEKNLAASQSTADAGATAAAPGAAPSEPLAPMGQRKRKRYEFSLAKGREKRRRLKHHKQ